MSGTTTFTVATAAELNAAIDAIDIGGSAASPNTAYVIQITTDLSLTSDIPAIDLAAGDTLSIQGDNADNTNLSAVIDGGGSRGFVVNSGSVEIANLSLIAMTAPGGTGGTPGGGGALYVGAGASVATSSVSFSGDSASGGTPAGGAVFVAQGGNFSVSGGSIAGSGNAAGNGIFIQGNGSITLSGATVTGVIADQTGSHLGSGAGSVITQGDVTLSATDKYTGGTQINGTLSLMAPGAAGSGAITFGAATGDTLAIGAGDTTSNQIDGFVVSAGTGSPTSNVIDLQGIGLATSYTLAAGNQLTVYGATGTVTLNLDPTQNYANDSFVLQADAGTGTAVTLAQTGFVVGSEADLNAALALIDVGGKFAAPGVSYTISFTANFALTTDLYAINLAGGSSLTIDGAGFTLDGGSTYRGFFDYAGGLTLENLTVQNAVAAGGAGGSGAAPGGGGAGLGGGLFVASGGAATLSNVTFLNDQAVGGAGGAIGTGVGGGGGLGGHGGAGGTRDGGGGGIGLSASGGNGGGGGGGAGIVLGAASGQSGTGNSLKGGAGGIDGGGGGGAGTITTTGSGRGGGGSKSHPGVAGDGGVGGSFGGGAASGGVAGFGGGGANSAGGWGGGGSVNAGGFGGGAGGSGAGGGLGAGGDVFVQQGGSLTILGGAMSGGDVSGGAGGNGGSAGLALGSGIFIQGGNTLTFSPAAGQTVTIADAIADESGSGGSGAGGVIVNGAGTVVLSAIDSFTGGTLLRAGTLSLQAPGAAGSGAISFAYGAAATLVFGAGDIPANIISGFLPSDVIDLQGIGTASAATLGAGDILTISGGTIPVQLALDPAQSFVGESFHVTTDNTGGTLLTASEIANDTPPSVSGFGTVAGDDHTPLTPLAGVTVSDLDPGQTETVTLTLSSPLNGTLSNLAGGSYDAASGVYTVSGSTSGVTTALDGLVFTPTINQVAPGGVVSTTFNLSVTDGLTFSTAAASTVNITALNDAPVISGTPSGLVEGYWNVPLSPFPAVTIADPDVGATETVTLSLSSNLYNPAGNGTLSLSQPIPGVTLTQTGAGSYALSAASPAAVTAALDALRFTAVPDPSVPGYTITYVGMSVSDGIAPAVTTQVEVLTGLPLYSGTMPNQSVVDGNSISPFSAVSVTDSAGLDIQGMTIVLYDSSSNYLNPTDANGVLSGPNLTKIGVGTYTVTPGSTAQVTAELNALVFTPTISNTPATTDFTLEAFDGATTADNGDTSVIAMPGAAVPEIAGTVAGQSILDNTTIAPFATASVSDTNAAPSDSASITLIDAATGLPTDANGTLAGAGLTGTGVGVYTLAATDPASLTAELQALVFTPTANEVPTGFTVTTDFSLAVTDANGTVTDGATSVVATASAGLPSITLTPVDGDNSVNAAAALTGFTIAGATTGVEDGQTVSIAIVDSMGNPVSYLSATVAGGAWSVAVPVAQSMTLADGGYTVLADVMNQAGFWAPEASEAVTVNLAGIVAAVPEFSTTSMAFGATRVGGPSVSRSIAISDGAIANPDQAALSYALSAMAGPFGSDTSASGTLVSGQFASINLAMATNVAGSFTTTSVPVTLTSLGGGTTGLPDTALPPVNVTLQGKVYALAAAQLSASSVDFGIVHVGDTVSRTLTVTNAASGGLTDVLIGGFGTVSAGFTGSGSLGTGVAAGKSGSLTLGVSTALAGSFTGSASLNFASHDADLANIAVAAGPVTLTAVVDNYAVAALKVTSSTGTITQTGGNYTVDLGSIMAGRAAPTVSLGALNAALGLADVLSGTFSTSGASAFANTGLTSFTGLAAGQADTAPLITLSTSKTGTFSETITLHPTDSNASGYSKALANESLTITGTITPSVFTLTTGADSVAGTAVSDTIVATSNTLSAGDTIDGGAGTNTLALTGGGTFDLTAATTLANIQAITAQEGAGVAAPIVTLRPGLNATVTVASAASGGATTGITIIGAANTDAIKLGNGTDSVTMGAGETVTGGTGNDSFTVTATTIKSTIHGGTGVNTLSVQGGGSVVMGSAITGIANVVLGTTTTFTANATANLKIAGSVAGGDVITLGAASQSVVSGGANELVKATAANAGAAVSGVGANSTLEVTSGGTVTENAVTSVATVKLDSATILTLNGMAFITAKGSTGIDTIAAGGSNQTLTGGSGADSLIGYSGGSDSFLDTASGLNGDTISNFLPSDAIDITDLGFAGAALKITASGLNTLVTATSGASKTTFTLAGSFSSAGFVLASDGHAGTLITHG